MSLRILLSDKIEKNGYEYLKKYSEVLISNNEKEFNKIIQEVDGVIVKFQQVKKEIISKSNRLKVIGKHGIGMDNIDVEYAKKRGIKVINVPDISSETVAEFTMAAILSTARNIPQAYLSLKKGVWDRERFKGIELKNKVLGIIGYGKIGRLVAEKFNMLGLKIMVYDPYIAEVENYVKVVSLEFLLKTSDFITLHLPLNSKNESMFGGKEFSLMKKDAYIFNFSRAKIINEQALLKAILNNKIRGAFLDVFQQEPPNLDQMLFKNDNIIVVPHIAAYTENTQKKISLQISKKLIKILKCKETKDLVKQ